MANPSTSIGHAGLVGSTSSNPTSTSPFSPITKMLTSVLVRWLVLTLALHHHHVTSGEKAQQQQQQQTTTATAASPSCHYTVVINEFDVSKCHAIPGYQPGHIQADGVPIPVPSRNDAPHIKVTSKGKSSQYRGGDAAAADTSGYYYGSGKSYGSSYGSKPGSGGGGEAPAKNLDTQLHDVESKLLEEMVRSREINSTLNRHALLLSTAQRTLESYRANFTAVFRTMMSMERRLKHQRRVNRSLNKKLSNVILDVVEVNNHLVSRMEGGKATKTPKTFSVESVGKVTSCPGISEKSKAYKDCASVYDAGHRRSDVYYIKPLYAACPIPVFCDMDSPKGGWLLIQRRKDGTVDFQRKWGEYRDGFGDVSGEHWLGNDNIFLLTNQDRYQLRVDMWDFSGNRVHAIYNTFKIEGERDDYRLHVSGYSGSAKDALKRHNNIKFSTVDRDHDNRREANCADEWEAGWWFDKCWVALLNGPYQNSSDVQWKGLAWNSWKREQLRASEMKIRPLYHKRR